MNVPLVNFTKISVDLPTIDNAANVIKTQVPLENIIFDIPFTKPILKLR